MKLKLLFPALLAVAISAFFASPVKAQSDRSDDDVYMNGNADDAKYKEEKYKEDDYPDEDYKIKEEKYKEERDYGEEDYGYSGDKKEKYKDDKYKYKEDGYKYKEERYKDEDDYGYGYGNEDRDRKYKDKDDEDYVCRPGHHYNCRHDRRGRVRTYWYPGGSVTIGSGPHGFVYEKIWVRGHWNYAPNGRRYWVPGHYSYDKVNW